MNTLVFDIETVPDTAYGRRLYGLGEASDRAVAELMFSQRRAEAGTDFLPLEQHRVVAIAAVMRSRETLKVWSVGEEASPEKELLERFFDGLDKYVPTLVTWNGAGFDLPVLHYRTLLHGVTAARYWETGENDTSFRYSNYLSRFHWRHMDLMDILCGFQGRGRASLSDMASLLGFPGKLGMKGAEVWDAYQRGELANIRAYCESDVLNTYLIFLRFELVRGNLSPTEHVAEVQRVRQFLCDSTATHHREFLAAWPAP